MSIMWHQERAKEPCSESNGCVRVVGWWEGGIAAGSLLSSTETWVPVTVRSHFYSLNLTGNVCILAYEVLATQPL